MTGSTILSSTITGGVPAPAFPASEVGTPTLDVLMWVAAGVAMVSVVYFGFYRAFVEWPRRKGAERRELPDWSAWLWYASAVIGLVAVLAAWGFDTLRKDRQAEQRELRDQEVADFYASLWNEFEVVYGVHVTDLSSWVVEDPDPASDWTDTVEAEFPDGHTEECTITRTPQNGAADVLALECPTPLTTP